MTSFVFWNVMKKDLRGPIGQLALEKSAEIVLLAETDPNLDDEICQTLEKSTGHAFESISHSHHKVRIFSRIKNASWILRQEGSSSVRMAIWSLQLSGASEILLAVVHLASKSNSSSNDQFVRATTVAKEIQRVEDYLEHQRTILVGDLNMNPFENGVINAAALHGVMTKKLASRKERIVENQSYRMFYNPMWGHFGDRTTGPPGTYYFPGSTTDNSFWNIYDQVIVRPDLMDRLTELEIIEAIGGQSLLTLKTFTPNDRFYSDHLPIAFKFNFRENKHD